MPQARKPIGLQKPNGSKFNQQGLIVIKINPSSKGGSHMLIASIPGPQNISQLQAIIKHPLVNGFRFNTGVKVPYSPAETLKRILDQLGYLDFWLDIKGRQLRITKWADPNYGEIHLNHNIKVDLPAQAIFRGDDICQINAIANNQIFVYPNPRFALGEGQSINIHGQNLNIKGYLTKDDVSYLKAARSVGVNKIMLSFVESNDDIKEVQKFHPHAQLCLKIESQKGLDFVKTQYNPKIGNINLMAARDDLFINLENKFDITSALQLIIQKDPDAFVASRILTSLVNSSEISQGDISDLYLLHQMGYQNFMLSDSISSKIDIFNRVMDHWKDFEIKKHRR